MGRHIILILLTVVIFYFSILSSFAGGTNTSADEKKTAVVVSDLLLVRPLGTVAASLSNSLFVLTLPITYPNDRAYAQLEKLVEHPWNFVSNRPLGDFGEREDIPKKIDEMISSQFADLFKSNGSAGSPATIK